MRIVVCDTSPLRALHHLDRHDLLISMFEEVIVHPGVVHELEQPEGKFIPVLLGNLRGIQVRSPSDLALVRTLAPMLDRGETEAIALRWRSAPTRCS